MIGNESVAEDLAQDAFIKVYNNLPNFRGDSKLSTWIYKIATNVSLDYFRTSSYKKSELTDLLDEDSNPQNSNNNVIDKVLSIEEELIKSEMSECVHDFVDRLPEDYRAVLVLHDLQDFKNKEIAEILGTSLENIKIRLHRARNKLRSTLASYCNFYRDKRNVLRCDRKGEDCL